MSNSTIALAFMPVMLVISVSRATAQHAGHQMTGQPPAPTCAEDARQALGLLTQTKVTLESARQINGLSDMRAAVANVQDALTTMESQLASCRTASPAQMDPSASPTPGVVDHSQMGHTMPMPPAAPTTPMDHSKMGRAMPMPVESATEVVDPICRMKVDPRTALKATSQGTDYYFCSEPDRQAFVTDPARYVKPQPK